MAEETQAAPAAQAFDVNAMAAQLQNAAAAGTRQAIEAVAARTQQERQEAVRQQQTQADPVASTILQTVEPALRNIAIKGDSGRDAAIFYATTPAAAKYAQQIETRHNELLNRGIPVDRASLWNLIRGENLDAFVEERVKQRDADLKRAQEAETVRGTRGAPMEPVRDAREMSPEDLAKAIENVSF